MSSRHSGAGGQESEGLPATERVDPRYLALDEWPSAVALDALLEAQMSAVAAVRPALSAIAAAAEAAVERLRSGGRLIYCGAGTSGRIGVQDGAELPPTFAWPEERLGLLIAGGRDALTRAVEDAEDSMSAATMDMAAQHVAAADVVVGLAASGSTPYVLGCIRHARLSGALTIGVANSPGGQLLAAVEHAILVQTGPEPIAGSTRLKAGTSQKVVLNLFSTLVMVRLGRVWRGQMVDMVARNEKLRRRAVRMVCDLTGCDPGAAHDALESSEGRVKLAVLLLSGVNQEDATARLRLVCGDLGKALAWSAG